jgi:hypothetical protein
VRIVFADARTAAAARERYSGARALLPLLVECSRCQRFFRCYAPLRGEESALRTKMAFSQFVYTIHSHLNVVRFSLLLFFENNVLSAPPRYRFGLPIKRQAASPFHSAALAILPEEAFRAHW